MFRRILALALLGGAWAASAARADDAPPRAGTANGVAVEFESDSSVLRGTAFVPGGRADGPGVVILGGSERGPQTVMKTRLAEHFVAAGVAALIYDSPGTGRSTGSALLQTRDDRAREALTAVRFLRSRERVRADRVGLMGISEGALVSLLAAARDESVAFAIPVSGAFGVPMLEQARYRIEVNGLARGLDAEQLLKAVLLEEILFALFVGPDRFEWRLIDMKATRWPGEPWDELAGCVRTTRSAASDADRDESWNRLRRTLMTWRSEPWFDLVVADLDRFDRFMSMSAAQFYVLLERGSLGAGDFDKVSRELREYPRVRCPVLAVWGGNDEYLPPRRSAAFLEKCLAGHADATILIVPEASHILTDPERDAVFAPGYPDLLSRWITQRFGGVERP